MGIAGYRTSLKSGSIWSKILDFWRFMISSLSSVFSVCWHAIKPTIIITVNNNLLIFIISRIFIKKYAQWRYTSKLTDYILRITKFRIENKIWINFCILLLQSLISFIQRYIKFNEFKETIMSSFSSLRYWIVLF